MTSRDPFTRTYRAVVLNRRAQLVKDVRFEHDFTSWRQLGLIMTRGRLVGNDEPAVCYWLGILQLGNCLVESVEGFDHAFLHA